MIEIKKKLKKHERQFCSSLVQTGDFDIAVRRAGLEQTAETGDNLMCEQRINDELKKLAGGRKKSLSALAATGYYRLAFGSVADAVSLLFCDNPSARELRKMDLFLVSEIKKPKDGSMEIKFFDRLKALEHLEQEAEDEATAKSFYEAIGESARGDADED